MAQLLPPLALIPTLTDPDPYPRTSPTTGRSVGISAGERLLHLRQTILRSIAVWRPGLHAQTEALEPSHLPLISPFVYFKTIVHDIKHDLHNPPPPLASRQGRSMPQESRCCPGRRLTRCLDCAAPLLAWEGTPPRPADRLSCTPPSPSITPSTLPPRMLLVEALQRN